MKRILFNSIWYVLTVITLLVLYFMYLQYEGSIISTGSPIPYYNNPKSALFVIDMQEGTTGSLAYDDSYRKQSPILIEKINNLIEMADSHAIPVIYIRQQNENWLLNFVSNNLLAKDSPGSKLDKRIKIVSENDFTKTIMDAFSNEALNDFLILESVNKIYITGLDAAYCVNCTAYAAKNRGYDVIIIDDAIISEDVELKSKMIKQFRKAGMSIILSTEFLIHNNMISSCDNY